VILPSVFRPRLTRLHFFRLRFEPQYLWAHESPSDLSADFLIDRVPLFLPARYNCFPLRSRGCNQDRSLSFEPERNFFPTGGFVSGVSPLSSSSFARSFCARRIPRTMFRIVAYLNRDCQVRAVSPRPLLPELDPYSLLFMGFRELQGRESLTACCSSFFSTRCSPTINLHISTNPAFRESVPAN